MLNFGRIFNIVPCETILRGRNRFDSAQALDAGSEARRLHQIANLRKNANRSIMAADANDNEPAMGWQTPEHLAA